jgi:pimeloyl-ACP methyl ester carboxylesterase
MKLDVVSYQGDADKPAVIFIHGLGMDRNIWANPSQTRVLGGMFPLDVMLDKEVPGKQSEGIRTLFEDLRSEGYGVVTWSQKRPAGPIDSVVPELSEVAKIANEMSDAGMVLVGHSRGGLIGRKYLLRKDKSVRGLVTISTPHRGSSVARVVKYLSPLAAVLNPLIPKRDRGTRSAAMKRILEFLKSRALTELLPGSDFFKTLKDGPLDQVFYASVGGMKPTLFHLYNLAFPDAFEKVIPEGLFPEEMKKGRGDGLVSAESSKFPWGGEHHNFDLNHVEILFDERVRNLLRKTIAEISL